MNLKSSREAIVIGPAHINTLGLIRSLGEAGISAIYIQTGGNYKFVSKSRYLKKSYFLSEINSLPFFLIDNFKNDNFKNILFPITDKVTSILDLEYSKLHEFFILPNAKVDGEVTKLMNKWVLYRIAEKFNILTPKSWIIKKDDNKKNLMDIVYPCITKSSASIEGGKSDVYICNNKEELLVAISNAKSNTIIIQQYINKQAEYSLFGIAVENNIYIPAGDHYLRFTPLLMVDLLK